MSFLSNFPGSSPRSSSSSMKELKKEEKKKHVYRGEIIDDENEAESVWKSILKRKGLPSDTKYQYIDTLDKAFDESYCDMLYQTIEEKKKNPEAAKVPMADSQAKELSFYRTVTSNIRDPMADSQTKELSFFQAGPFGIRVGDSVITTYGAEGVEADVFARITSIKSNTLGVNFRIQRYYTPEETVGGKQPFYGNKELLLTNHLDNLDPKQIVKKINVHSFVDYMKLETVGPNDYFFRFEYEIGSGWLSPAVIEVFCKCLMPFNPDMFTLKCEACKERYHPDCIKMTLDEAKQLADNFTCSDCLAPDNQGCASAASATVDP